MITILTPTYNRAYTLGELYKSLSNQTSKDFEWILIDDGSTDNTMDLIEEWTKQTNSFDIRYVYQGNGGKHRAVNRGVGMAKYDFCFIVDSDDIITENAIERITSWIQTIEKDDSFAGVSGLKGYVSGVQIGGYPRSKRFQNYIDANNLQRKKFNLVGDKAEIYRTKILRKYPFPEFVGEDFLSEAVVWDAIARDGYNIRWFNEIIYLCEYLDDGLTRNLMKKYADNFEGYTYYIRQVLLTASGWLARQFVAGTYVSIAKQKGLTLSKSAERLEVRVGTLLVAYFVFYVKNKIQSSINFVKNLFNVMENVNGQNKKIY